MHELLQRWARAIHEGRAPHPQTWRGFTIYAMIGVAIGMTIARFMSG